jgi:predicted HicB family RNase H-like nuclease
MTILVYKGYQGSIEYEDGHIVIQLLHIDDFVSTSCNEAKMVEITFHSLVEEYLETCIKLGKEPDKPYKGSLNVRMPADLHRSLAKAATQEGISLNSWIVDACRAKLSTDSLASGAAILGEDRTSLLSIIAAAADSLPSSPSLRQPHSGGILAPFLQSPTAVQQQLRAG